MARLRLSAFVNAPIEEVYEYVTAFGRDGPLDAESFREKYGVLLRREEDAFIVQEDVRAFPEDEPLLITWRCTFRYPLSRTMEALDSRWANRRDTFREVDDGTAWRVQWDTWGRGLRGIIQYLAFRLVGHRRIRRELLDPVKEHFEKARGPGE